jgi:N-acetylmuramoyl-L-alanine amidase
MNQTRPIAVIGLAVLLFAAVFGLRAATSGPGTTSPSATDTTVGGSTTTSPGGSPGTTEPDRVLTRIGYLLSREGTVLAPEPGAPGRAIAGGIVFPIVSETAGGYQVLDSCNRPGWVAADDVIPGEVPVDRDPGRFDHAVFVIDPGHGLPDLGAVGPTRLFESVANLAISQRLFERLTNSHDIDWATGRVTPGPTVPAAAVVVLTRSPDGPNGGDYELSLTYRSEIANSMGATALVSIHNNSSPSLNLDHPGSESYVSHLDPESARLGGLVTDELRREFARFEADWVGHSGSGVRSRIGSTGGDFYTLIDEADMPAVIVEGAFISNPSEEALLRTTEFQQAYADAVYRALIRWVTTDDNPIPAPTPEPWPGPGGLGRDWTQCVVPGVGE